MTTYVFIAVLLLSPPPSPEAAPATSVRDIRYVDFPASIDPLGEHRHVPLEVGSRVYLRRSLRVRELSRTSGGLTFEHTEAVDAASRITRLPNDTLVVEPDGTQRRFTADAVIDRSDPSRNFRIVVIPPDVPIPAYLRDAKPVIVVR